MFKVARRTIADTEPFVYLKGAESLTLGMAVKLASGQLAKCGSTDKPTHIIMGPMRTDGTYPAIAVVETSIFETTSQAQVAETVIGSSVTLGADALSVTASTTSGVFKVLETDAATPNSLVRGVFVEPVSAD